MKKPNHMAKTPTFVPFIGEYWTETLSNDPFILNELKRLSLSKQLRKSSADLTMLGKNKRLVLRYLTGQAFSVWEKQLLTPKQYVINCVLFVNNSQKSSKDLLQEAMKFARLRWIEYPFHIKITVGPHPVNFKKLLLEQGWKRNASSSTYMSNHGSLWEKRDDNFLFKQEF